MNTAVVVLLVVATVTYGFKAAGPLLLGGDRQLPGWLLRTADALPVPLLAALVVVATVVADGRLVIDARIAGLAAAAIALALRAPFIVVVIIAALATAGVRAVG